MNNLNRDYYPKLTVGAGASAFEIAQGHFCFVCDNPKHTKKLDSDCQEKSNPDNVKTA